MLLYIIANLDNTHIQEDPSLGIVPTSRRQARVTQTADLCLEGCQEQCCHGRAENNSYWGGRRRLTTALGRNAQSTFERFADAGQLAPIKTSLAFPSRKAEHELAQLELYVSTPPFHFWGHET